MRFIGIMWKLLSAVCLGTAVISQAIKNQYPSVPVVPLQADSDPSYYIPYSPVGLRHVGKVPSALPPIPQPVPNAVPSNYQYSAPVDRQLSPNQQQKSVCENSEILFQIWTILLNLFETGGAAKNPDVENFKLALKLIKEYMEKAPESAKNYDMANKLLMLERYLLKDKDPVSVIKRAYRTVTDSKDTFDPLITFKHKFPENVKPDCKEQLAEVIKTAQESYNNLVNSPICSVIDNPQDFLRRHSPVFSVNQYKRANFPNIQNSNAKINDALKESLELLKNQSSYNANEVFELLQNYKPVQTTNSFPIVAIASEDNDPNLFENPNQAKPNPYLQTSDYNAPPINYNNQQLPDNPAIIDWTNDTKPSEMNMPNNEIELTYALKRPQPLVYQPFYFIKYRLPFHYFLQNLGQVTQQKAIGTSKSELYKKVIQKWNADEISPDLSHFTKDQVNDLVVKEGYLVDAKLIHSNGKGMKINLEPRENVRMDISKVDFVKHNSENYDGKHIIEAQASPYLTITDETMRRKFKSNPRLDSVPKKLRYISLLQKGPPASSLKGFSDHLLHK